MRATQGRIRRGMGRYVATFVPLFVAVAASGCLTHVELNLVNETDDMTLAFSTYDDWLEEEVREDVGPGEVGTLELDTLYPYEIFVRADDPEGVLYSVPRGIAFDFTGEETGTVWAHFNGTSIELRSDVPPVLLEDGEPPCGQQPPCPRASEMNEVQSTCMRACEYDWNCAHCDRDCHLAALECQSAADGGGTCPEQYCDDL